MFTEAEQKAFRQKTIQLQKVKLGTLSPQALADSITKRRVDWFEKNKDVVLARYRDLPDIEKAYRIIYLDHMQINREHSKIVKIKKNKIQINSHNFCPYLEACKKLKLKTEFVCKEIGEPSIQRVCEMINPKLKFSRNYSMIRPKHNFCEEYIELL